MKKKSNAKIVAMLTAFLMVFAMMPLVAFGEEAPDQETPAGDEIVVDNSDQESPDKDVIEDVVENAVNEETQTEEKIAAAGAEDTSASAEQMLSAKDADDVVEYPLWVGGTQVTTENYKNIPAAEGCTQYSGTASYDPSTNTLTLDQYNYTGNGYRSGSFYSGIYCNMADGLTVVLKGDNHVAQSGYDTHDPGINLCTIGMWVRNGNLTITGTGNLTLDAIGADEQPSSYGLDISAGSINITGGTVTANAYESEYYCEGIRCSAYGELSITGGSVIATAQDRTNHTNEYYHSAGVYHTTVNIGKNAGEVIISGYTSAVLEGSIKNEKDGKGWTNVDGTEGETAIPVNTEGASYDYKRVRFLPNLIITAKDQTYTYNGQKQGPGDAVYEDPAEIAEMVTVTGLKDGDELSSIVVDGQGTDVGKYALTPSNANVESSDGSSVNDKYDIIYVPGTLEIIAEKKKEKEETKTTVNGTLIATMTAQGPNALGLTWSRISGVDGYDIFLADCGDKGQCKLAGSTAGSASKWIKSGLKKKNAYKAYVKAYVMKDGKKSYVKTSPTVHAYTLGYTKKYTNAKSVKVNKTKVSVKKGKKIKIKAKVKKLKKGKRLMPGHEVKVRYLSTDTSIATVSGKGKIKGVKKGTCYVYAYAHNGVFKKITVTVK